MRRTIVVAWLFALGAIICLPSIALSGGKNPKATLPSNEHTLFPPQKVKIPEDIPYYIIRPGPWHVKRLPYTEDKLLSDRQAGKELPPMEPIILPPIYLWAYFNGWQYRIAEIIGVIKEKKIKPWEDPMVSRGITSGFSDRGMQSGYLDCQARAKSLRREMSEDKFRKMAQACYLPLKGFLEWRRPPSYNPLGPQPVGPNPYGSSSPIAPNYSAAPHTGPHPYSNPAPPRSTQGKY